MPPKFFQLGMALAALALVAKGEVCPENAIQPSQWAEQRLQFTPSPKQAEALDAEDRFLILSCHRQWGKTMTIAIKALHHALTNPQQTIVILTRARTQSGILIQKTREFAARLGHPIRRAPGHSQSLRFPNGSQILAVPHTTESSTGITADVLIVDEAAQVKDDVYYTIAPVVARTQGAVWLVSTPGRPKGFFYKIWRDKKDIRWRRILSTVKDTPAIDKDFLAMQRRACEIQFRQDYHCEFHELPDRLFTEELLDSIAER